MLSIVTYREHIYWADAFVVRRSPKRGGSSEQLVRSNSPIVAIAIHEGTLYWANRKNVKALGPGKSTSRLFYRAQADILGISTDHLGLRIKTSTGSVTTPWRAPRPLDTAIRQALGLLDTTAQ